MIDTTFGFLGIYNRFTPQGKNKNPRNGLVENEDL